MRITFLDIEGRAGNRTIVINRTTYALRGKSFQYLLALAKKYLEDKEAIVTVADLEASDYAQVNVHRYIFTLRQQLRKRSHIVATVRNAGYRLQCIGEIIIVLPSETATIA